MLNYDYFYRVSGIRNPGQLVNPVVNTQAKFSFPKRSIFHFTGTSNTEIGPTDSDYIINGIGKPIFVENISNLSGNKGQPRFIPVQVDKIFRQHLVKNKRYRRLLDFEAADKDDLSLIMYNYAMLPSMYRYMRSFYTDYYRWYNVQQTIWTQIGHICSISDRHHFVKVGLPNIIPSYINLEMGKDNFNQKIAKLFTDPNSRFLLELWKWITNHRHESLLNLVDKKDYHKINLVFEIPGYWMMINLGKLDSWRKATKEELSLDPDANNKGYDSQQVGKLLLKTLMVLFEVKVGNSENATIVSEDTLETTGKTDILITDPKGTKILPSVIVDDKVDKDINFEEIEKELNQLDEINQNLDVSEVDEVGADIPTDIFIENESDDLETPIKNVCDVLAEAGMISAAEYKRHLNLSNSYKSIKAPNGQTLDKFIEIKPEDLKITESHQIADISTVFDKTMLKSSLHDFDKKYITEVLEKDIASMVMNIQKAGISVTDYNVETVDDIMGSFVNYSVKIVPIEGASSTLKFTLPKIKEDGTFEANGVKYLMRKQTGDIPIRKIGPDRVALTSYYGKTFVSRSSKRVFDYWYWLRNQITIMALDTEDSRVISMQPGMVFDKEFECPKAYSSLGMGFKSLILQPVSMPRALAANTLELYFSRKDVLSNVSDETIKKYEKDGIIVIGIANDGKKETAIICLDDNNHLYFTFNNELVPFGTIASILEIETSNAPVEFAELKVLGKQIPICFVLGYELGLTKLLKLLNVEVRRVPVGTRASVNSDEYSIVFDDETLVLPRDNEFASIVLAGFNDYSDVIRSYSVFDFDRKDIYLNVLESKKISLRYLKEIELLYQMFIDPITKEILQEMNEPQTFRGLLIRSCEMLLKDTHPSEIDPAFMRKKGYERFAGTIYSEMVKSIRIHRSRSDKHRAPIDVNPLAVWMNISQDPSKILISEINPVQNLKEMESVTFGGTGGRSSRSMVKGTRIYHKNDMGVTSEATVDSGDVGINTLLSADPQFTSLRGLTKRYEIGKTGATALLSTSALLAPGSDRDDPKRVFTNALID